MKFLGGRRSGDKEKKILISKIFFFFSKKNFSNFIFKPSTPKKFHVFIFDLLALSGKIFGFQKDFFFSDLEIKKVTKRYLENLLFPDKLHSRKAKISL